jgi:hypothetical protein
MRLILLLFSSLLSSSPMKKKPPLSLKTLRKRNEKSKNERGNWKKKSNVSLS